MDGVLAVAAVNDIAATTGIDQVAVLPAIDRRRSTASGDRVTAQATIDQVVTAAAGDQVTAEAAKDQVMAGAPDDRIGAPTANNRVVAGTGLDGVGPRAGGDNAVITLQQIDVFAIIREQGHTLVAVRQSIGRPVRRGHHLEIEIAVNWPRQRRAVWREHGVDRLVRGEERKLTT